jgi:hypothetical protein
MKDRRRGKRLTDIEMEPFYKARTREPLYSDQGPIGLAPEIWSTEAGLRPRIRVVTEYGVIMTQ